MDEQQTVELQLQIFGSPGGKSRVSDKLVEHIPSHKTYVEPFAGGAAVFFKKPIADVEVLNDKNTEIAFAYSFVKSVNQEQMNRLKSMNWEPSKELFFKLRDSEIPKDPVQRFYRFYYVLIYSYGLSSKTYGYFEKNKFHLDKRLPKLQERLKNTHVYSGDYMEVMKKYDSENTFFFLDPPYPEEWTGPEGTKLFSKEDTQKLHDYLKTIKGKFLMTINSLKWIVDMFADFKEYKLLVPRTFKHGDEAKYELIVTNYELKKEQKNAEENKEEIYNKWKELVNMTEKELKDFYDSDEGKKAGLTKEEADKEGIKSGRESAEWIMKMLPISKSFSEAEEKWTSNMWEWAKRQNSFISRMKGVEGPLFDDKGNKTRKHLSLLIWGHDPTKKENAETGAADVAGSPSSTGGLQPVWIYKPKKKEDEKLEEEAKLIKDVENYDPSKIDNKVLADDMRIVFAWYSTYKESNGEGIRFSLEDIINLAKLIYEEIEKKKAR